MEDNLFNRQVREVDYDWQHPMMTDLDGNQVFRPLFGHSYREHCLLCRDEALKDKAVVTSPTSKCDHMPQVKGDPWYQLYETLTAGTPMSPVLKTREELLAWVLEHNVCVDGRDVGSRALWEKIIFEK